ncbi:MAG: hypothetical protein H6509_10870 [Bryobacterales bacterium]|nr:hypothetical protein [Acidobacteriota bacterium]MCB9385110.1 hypothetical protein [Bryobacterales bacterium]
MERFPKLKTGAAAQYGAQRQARRSTQTARFLDSSEQRYRDFAGEKRSWAIRLEKLTSTELADIRDFFIRMRGSQTEFELEDPWSGAVIAACRFAQDEIADRVGGESSESVTLTIRES